MYIDLYNVQVCIRKTALNYVFACFEKLIKLNLLSSIRIALYHVQLHAAESYVRRMFPLARS